MGPAFPPLRIGMRRAFAICIFQITAYAPWQRLGPQRPFASFRRWELPPPPSWKAPRAQAFAGGRRKQIVMLACPLEQKARSCARFDFSHPPTTSARVCNEVCTFAEIFVFARTDTHSHTFSLTFTRTHAHSKRAWPKPLGIKFPLDASENLRGSWHACTL